MPSWSPSILILAFSLTLIVTPLVIALAQRFKVLDVPNERKSHGAPIPLLGGLAVILAVAVSTSLVLLTSDHLTAGEIDPRHYIGIGLALLVLAIGGALDDRYNLRARYSVAFPLVAVIIAVASGIGVDKMTNPLGDAFVISSVVSGVITFGWLLGMTYTTKLLDGVDGLATSVTTVGALMIAALALSKEYFQPDVALLALIVAAALIGFLCWNFSPAKVFLGESGSTALGFMLGVLAIISGSKFATALLVLGIPILDVFIVLARRAWSGKPMAQGDRSHLHYFLADLGWKPGVIVALYSALAALFGLTTLILSSWQKLVALAILFILGACGIALASKKRHDSR